MPATGKLSGAFEKIRSFSLAVPSKTRDYVFSHVALFEIGVLCRPAEETSKNEEVVPQKCGRDAYNDLNDGRTLFFPYSRTNSRVQSLSRGTLFFPDVLARARS